ncbi:MAG: pirin family protein, partial [Nitrososphaerales archaeon]
SDGNKVRVICGELGGTRGPVRDIVTDPAYLDVAVVPGGSFVYPTPGGHTVFAYVIQGKGSFCCQDDPYAYEAEGANYFDMNREPLIGNGNLVLFGDGDAVTAEAGDEGVRFLLISGKPIGEPVAWYGPIVMNTQQELRTAFEELQRGTFIKSHK